jgi:hypothetical protein
MPKYELAIREHNIQAHIDVENDLQLQKNGIFTFVFRVNNGNIVDYNLFENVNSGKYLNITKITIQEYSIARDTGE